MNKPLLWIGLGLCLGSSAVAETGVYRCVSTDGAVTYQDVRCAQSHPDNRVLPIRMHARANHRTHRYEKSRILVKQKEKLAMQIARRRQQETKKEREAKLAAQKKAAWRANRCEHAQSQKADVLCALRRGYRANAEPHLRERLKKIEDRERRYCQITRHH